MTQLVSKVQYRNFETGEFEDERERNFEGTIDLIEKFSWDEQRKKIKISLTNPSITITGKNGDHMKVAVFYNQKYVLYYYNKKQELFTKSFIDIKSSFDDIRNFFDLPMFDAAGFHKEKTWFQHNLKHFVTKDFHYLVTPVSIQKYLCKTSGVNFLTSAVLIILMVVKLHSLSIIPILFTLVIMFLIGGGVNLIFFFNYYNHLKGKMLIMSKGNNNFFFGSKENPVMFHKDNILFYTTIKVRSGRSLLSAFSIVEIEMMDGTCLKIPNLLVDQYELENKLSGIPNEIKYKLPYL